MNLRTIRTLSEANKILGAERPGVGSSPAVMLAFLRRSERVYREVAETDRGHHHEALYWANREREQANALAEQIGKAKREAAKRKAEQAARAAE